jgi:hypothetical protein
MLLLECSFCNWLCLPDLFTSGCYFSPALPLKVGPAAPVVFSHKEPENKPLIDFLLRTGRNPLEATW